MGWTAQLVLDNQTMVSQIMASMFITEQATAIAYAATLRSGLLPCNVLTISLFARQPKLLSCCSGYVSQAVRSPSGSAVT